MYPARQLYSEIMKLFKLSLPITPSTANVERGFFVLTLLHTKQQNSLSPSSLDQLMRIVLLGDEKPDWEAIVKEFRDSTPRRIEL